MSNDALIEKRDQRGAVTLTMNRPQNFNALSEEMLVIGSARYTAKPREQIEYLYFEISREKLANIASQSDVRFHLGNEEFSFTRSQ